METTTTMTETTTYQETIERLKHNDNFIYSKLKSLKTSNERRIEALEMDNKRLNDKVNDLGNYIRGQNRLLEDMGKRILSLERRKDTNNSLLPNKQANNGNKGYSTQER